MKKNFVITSLFLATSLTSPIFLGQAHATEVSPVKKNLALPNLADKKVAKELNSHTFKYSGISIEMSKNAVQSKLGKPNKTKLITSYGTKYMSATYGKKDNVIFDYSTDKNKLMIIDIFDKTKKYNFSKIYPLYKKDYILTNENNKKYLSNDGGTITFTKIDGQYYATELRYWSYNTFLE